MPNHFVYILTNSYNKVLYTGMTNNLKQRIQKHKSKHKGFTAKYNVTKLIYYEKVDSRLVALKREKQIKNLVRRKKIDLVNDINPQWNDLEDTIAKH